MEQAYEVLLDAFLSLFLDLVPEPLKKKQNKTKNSAIDTFHFLSKNFQAAWKSMLFIRPGYKYLFQKSTEF